MKLTTATIALLVLGGISTCEGGNILVVFPVPGKSHSILGNSIVNTLLDAGHQVTYLTPFPLVTNNTKLKNADISSILFDLSDMERLNIEKMATYQKPSQWVLQIGNMFAMRALKHSAIQELLNDPGAMYDLVIAEWFYSGLLSPLAAVYDCPLIWYTSVDVFWQSLRMVHESTSPAYSVDLQSRMAPAAPFASGDKIRQMMQQMYLNGWTLYFTNYVEKPEYYKIFNGPLLLRGRHVHDYESIAYNASMLLINSHPLLGQNVPLPGNAKYIGGHHLSANPKPLSQNLKKVLDESKQGVIYFSLGSNLKSRDLPENMKRELLRMFGTLEQTVLWKMEDDMDDVPDNVHLMEWAPQESILMHPNLFLIVNQGGLLSIMEATQNGVPMVSIPIFGDQFVNVDQMVHRGCGIRVDFSADLANKMRGAINEILSNSMFYFLKKQESGELQFICNSPDSVNVGSSFGQIRYYRTNAKFASYVFQQRLASPKEELRHWVQLVMDTNGASFLRSPARDIPTLQRLHFDVLLLIVVALWFLSKVAKVIKAHLNGSGSEEAAAKKDD